MVSIIMPVYNGEKYIKNAIESVLGQTYKDWELIIINDGSTDRTVEICKQFTVYKNIKLYNNANCGVSASRNFGVEIAKGECITFIDADDIYAENFLEVMSKTMKKSEEIDLVYCKYWFSDEKKMECAHSENILSKDSFVDDVLFNQKRTCVWRCMMKSRIAKTVKFRNMKYTEDLFYVLDYIQKCNKIAMIDDKLYVYKRDNQSSMTNNTRQEKYISDFLSIPVFMYKYLIDNGYKAEKYKRKIADEYAYACIRVRKATTYSNFVKQMNSENFRCGLSFASEKKCDIKKRIVFILVKNRIYFPLAIV